MSPPPGGVGMGHRAARLLFFPKAEVGDFQLTCLGLGGPRRERELNSTGPGVWRPIPGLNEFPKHRARDTDHNSLQVLSWDSHVSAFPSEEGKKNASLVGTGSWLLGHVIVTPPSTTQKPSWQGTFEISQPDSQFTVRKDAGRS